MAVGSVAGHKMNQHGRAEEVQQSWKTSSMGEEPQTYQMAFLAKVGPQSFLVEGCLGQLETRTEMWVHFLYRHVLDTVVIL